MKDCCRAKTGTCAAETNPQPAMNFAKDRKRKDGRTVHCKSCLRVIREPAKDKQKVYLKNWRKRNPEKCRLYDEIKARKHGAKARQKRYVLKTRYGITTQEWQKMHEDQNHSCPICLRHMDDCVDRVLHVDHCHETGKVRGLLCSTCNKAIGLLKDDTKTLQRCVEYLQSHSVRLGIT